MVSHPKVFFDTCVYLEVEKTRGLIPPPDWRFLQHYVKRNYRTCVSWPTLKELLVRIAKGDDAHFTSNQRALRELLKHGTKRGRFLDKPNFFAIERVLGIGARPPQNREGDVNPPHQNWVENVLRAVFQAQSKTELTLGVQSGLSRKQRAAFDLDDFAAYEEQPRLEHVAICEGLRTGHTETGSRMAICGALLKDTGRTPYTEHCVRLSEALDAWLAATEWLWNASKNSTYNFDKKKNDWDDLQQLFYLCDPSLCFVTLNTKDFVTRTRGSTQHARIISWADFLAQARRAVS